MAVWRPGWDDFPQPLLDFWTDRHLLTLSTLRPDGRLHVVPVGVALDPEERCAWVITHGDSRKARNLEHGGALAACQVDGGRWSTLEGSGVVLADADSVARACERYAARYRVPRENPARVAIRIQVERFVSSSAFSATS